MLCMSPMSETATPQSLSISTQMVDEPVVVEQAGGHVVVRLSGEMITTFIAPYDAALAHVGERLKDVERLTFNGETLEDIDTAGAWLIHRLRAKAADASIAVDFVNMPKDATDLLDAVTTAVGGSSASKRPRAERFGPVEAVGWVVTNLKDDFVAALHILGAAVQGSQMKRGHRNKMSWAPIAAQIDQMGIRAIPIIILMSTIIGAILAQQGAFELAEFGAEIFVVDLVGILSVREIGVLLTAIMVAGRSGSAITAEIGSMKMREEIDALNVIGLNPIGVLVFPRLVALAIALPMLTVIANASAMGGAMAVCYFFLGITPEAFLDRAHFAIEIKDVLAGLAKAPVMAMFIGIIASVEGMKVGGSAESLGRSVTASVVKVIFVVIVVDGLFAMFYAGADI
ncbi:MAG: ABC transporter permease [Pseudomonadota bacterium]